MTPPSRPGLLTSEFWVTLAALASATLVAAHLIPAADYETVSKLLTDLATTIVALVAQTMLAHQYVQSRLTLKTTPMPQPAAAPASLVLEGPTAEALRSQILRTAETVSVTPQA